MAGAIRPVVTRTAHFWVCGAASCAPGGLLLAGWRSLLARPPATKRAFAPTRLKIWGQPTVMRSLAKHCWLALRQRRGLRFPLDLLEGWLRPRSGQGSLGSQASFAPVGRHLLYGTTARAEPSSVHLQPCRRIPKQTLLPSRPPAFLLIRCGEALTLRLPLSLYTPRSPVNPRRLCEIRRPKKAPAAGRRATADARAAGGGWSSARPSGAPGRPAISLAPPLMQNFCCLSSACALAEISGPHLHDVSREFGAAAAASLQP